MTVPPPPPWPTARVLRHDCADGSWHYDWLLVQRAPASAEDRCVLAWRVLTRPDEMPAGSHQDGERLPAHRAFYLGFEGDVQLSDGRGRVKPVVGGMIEALRTAEASGTIEARGTADTFLNGLTVRVRWDSGALLQYRITRPTGTASVERIDCIECITRIASP